MIDVNCDGKKDLVLCFSNRSLNLTTASTSATLTADTTDGKHVMGTGSVIVFECFF